MQFQLTEYAHGGGCGCKTAPGAFSQSLGESAGGPVFPDLLVGNEHADDVAVYRLSHSQALVATTDFFMPVVDDPFDFGRIAPTNALSDIDAMGAAPIMALVVLGIAGPQRLKRNSDARARDDVVLSKPLAVVMLSAALMKRELDAPAYAEMIAGTTTLNRPG